MKRTLTAYTCPALMWLQFWIMRLVGRPVFVTDRICRRTPKGHGVEVRAWWPVWMILAECWLHNNLTPRLKRLVR